MWDAIFTGSLWTLAKIGGMVVSDMLLASFDYWF